MKQRSGFVRKVVYACTIFVLLLPLFWLSQPATKESRGGKLAQLRSRPEYPLTQASLGEIDPAGETMKLATLGMRGVAANILWHKANEYKKKEDWSGLSATLEQITKLQPNFIAVWRFQGWNLSYNVSVEFDDYRDRYYWVMKGVEYLEKGTQYNAKEPRLLWDIGWFIAQKIGRADEHKQYRRLFKEDDDYHNRFNRPRGERDNWLVGREWFIKAQNLVKSGVTLKGISDMVFHSDPAMCQINYSDALEADGVFGEVAKAAWTKAGREWFEYGRQDLVATDGVIIHLNDEEEMTRRSNEAKEELRKLAPEGLIEKIQQEKIDRLSKAERAARDTAPEQRTEEQKSLIYQVEEKLQVHDLEIAERIEGENRARALQLADNATQAQFMAGVIDRYRDTVNFEFWRLRCEFERTDNAVNARKLVYQADQAMNEGKMDEAIKLYEEGFEKWGAVIKEFPAILQQSILTEDLADAIERYQDIVEKVGGKFPENFVLQEVVEIEAPNRHKGFGQNLESNSSSSEKPQDDGKAPQESQESSAGTDASEEASNDSADGSSTDSSAAAPQP